MIINVVAVAALEVEAVFLEQSMIGQVLLERR
jgi:hypothetical protein